jgi:sugar diacid utilization regulator
MSSPDRALAPGGPVADGAFRRLAELSSELQQLLDDLSGSIAMELSPASAALARMLDGGGAVADAQLLGQSVRGARVLVVQGASPSTASMLEGRLGNRHVISDLPRRADDDRGRRLAASLAGAVLRESPAAFVGVSSPVADAAQLRSAFLEAVDAAAIARGNGDRWALADEQWAQIGIARLVQHAAASLTLANPLRRLADYDADHGCDLARTVGAWLANNGDTATTARMLAVHANTLRYRLRRAQDISGLNLDDADSRILAQLLLR